MLVRDARIDGTPDGAERDRRRPGARAHLPRRPLDADARRRRAARLVGGDRVDDAAGVGLGAVGGHARRAAHGRRSRPSRGGFIAEQSGDRQRQPLGRLRQRRAVRSRSRGSARPTIADRRCRCGRAPASPQLVALGEDSTQVTSSIQLEVVAGAGARRGRRAAGRARRQPGRGRGRRRLERRGQHADRDVPRADRARRRRS